MSNSETSSYVRVGTEYYKYVHVPLLHGGTALRLVPWTSKTISLDLGTSELRKVKCYDGFCNLPSHLSFKKEHHGFLNLYRQIPFSPKEGPFEITSAFLKHIFEEQYEIGLDYLTILYRYPTQKLPILCLVSRDERTGKTSFLNFLKLLFSDNVTLNSIMNFRSQFNSDWVAKLLICVEEVLLDKSSDSELLKNLATSETFKSEAKGKDRIELEFFGKFVFCSNHEDNFIQIKPGETRYWVRKIKTLAYEDVNMLDKLKSEAPAFLYYLSRRQIIHPEKTRMWFESSILKTNALRKVMANNGNKAQFELMEILKEIMDEFEVDHIRFILSDLFPFFKSGGIRVTRAELKNTLEVSWKLEKCANSHSYTRYTIVGGSIIPQPGKKGRYFEVTKAFLDEKMNEV